jgi:sensor histidine kinase regulating citrate/malate metabolism
VVFEVMDNGVGPPAKSKVKGRSVFEYGVSGKNGGSGIGLALCREVVEGLGGTIELLTRTDGKRGAVLRVRYPAPGVVVERVVG